MTNVCVLLADGFEEIEAVTLIDVLRRADVKVVTLGVSGTRVMGAHGIPIMADRPLAEATEQSWDVVILPGGMPGAATLRDDERVQTFLRRHASSGGQVAAICAAPIALGAAGLLEGRHATCFPGFEEQLPGARLSTARVVQDGNVITSRGPGTAMELALHLVTELRGADRAEALRSDMLAPAAR